MDRLRRRFNLDHNPSVLSFADDGSFPQAPGSTYSLGEVYLCAYYIKKEARKQSITSREWEARLVAHGVLHLLGYDHDTNGSARVMEGIERSLFLKKSS